MKLTIISTLILATVLPLDALAGRYAIPNDNEVISRLGGMGSPKSHLERQFNVLIWNVYKAKIEGWEDDYEILSSKTDLQLLQEGFLNSRMSRVFNQDKESTYVMATAWYDKKRGNTKSGILTGSNAKPISTQWQRSYYKEPILRTPKMALFTKYKVKGTEKLLLVVNIHGINFVTAGKLAHMIRSAATVVDKHDGPVLFAGDFNTWTGKKLGLMNTILKAVGMEQVSFNPDLRKKMFGIFLDHVWVRDLEVIDAEVYGDIMSSDHKPMKITLSLQ